MRRMSLWGILIASLVLGTAPRADAVSSAPPFEQLVEAREWDKVLELIPKETTDPLQKLLRARALFELEKWDELLSLPKVEDARFDPYVDYLKISGAHQAKRHELVLQWPIPEQLPRQIKQTMAFLRGQSLIALEKWPEAKTTLRDFLKDYPRSIYTSDVLLELAQVEWNLDNKFEALHLYEKIYTEHPLKDASNLAEQRLREGGRFQELDAAVHLLRADQLKRAALFSRGLKELQKLKGSALAKDQDQIDLAMAGLEFSARKYSRAESLSKKALKNKNLDQGIKNEWELLLAFALVRQGKYDEARPIYDRLLKAKISPREKETIHLRLGMMAVDDQNHEAAAKHFRDLRTQFSKGRFQETAHWFESWAIYQLELTKKAKDPTYKVDSRALTTASDLLTKLPRLPEGERLHPQAIYWQGQIAELNGKKKEAQTIVERLNKHWKASFHHQLTQEKPFDFLNFNAVDISPDILDKKDPNISYSDSAFQSVRWRRVEAFAPIKLTNWARMELDEFREEIGEKNKALRYAIAYRLKDLRDWTDLANYARFEFPLSIEDLDMDDPVVRFHYPQAFPEQVLKASEEFQVSPFLVWGVMREESRFQADVVSAAGAVGLLQLIPSLGDRIAKALGQRPMGRRGLTDPDKNVRYGVFHLDELIKRVQGLKVPPEFVFPLAVASYNAGFGPVRRWVENIGTERVDLFVENIPYTETRNYVKRVLQSANIYYRLYGEKVRQISKSKETKSL